LIIIKDFLKSMNCCRSECYNNTIENVNIDHIEGLYNAIQELQIQIHNLSRPQKVSYI